MTTTPVNESDSCPGFQDRIGFLTGNWLPHHDMRLPLEDSGFRQGVTVVERLRTYSQQIFALDAHLIRWQHSVSELSITGLPSNASIAQLMLELLSRNALLLQSEGDVGITMFATPGEFGPGKHGSAPTFGLHLNLLNHARHEHHRQHGQPLIVTGVQQPDPQCWARTIKVRSRLHYYLADRKAREQDENAIAVLVDSDGSVTETSIANLAIVEAGQILSPPADRVLGGVTQSMIESLASQASIGWAKRPISVTQLRQADEILMMGTDGGIWFANSVDGNPIVGGNAGDVFHLLRKRFDQTVVA
jgi:branched-chain amino acid aminotransferase